MKSLFGWKLGETRMVESGRVFELVATKVRSPGGRFEGDFFYLNCVDWVNVIALTERGEVVLIRQFRPPVEEQCLEIPGGMLDAAEEDPQAAALRELEEETGYVGEEIELIGSVFPNPALNNNRCHFYLVKNVRLHSKQSLDPAEDISVELVPLKEIPRLIRGGAIKHALVLNAFLFLYTLRPELLK